MSPLVARTLFLKDAADGRALTYHFQFEPFSGRLVGISR